MGFQTSVPEATNTFGQQIRRSKKTFREVTKTFGHQIRRFGPLLLLIFGGCDDGAGADPEPRDAAKAEMFGVVQRPSGFPEPKLGDATWPSESMFDLGRALFYETALSGNGTQSCASCHEQSRAFAQGHARSVGSTGQAHTRNASSLVNVAYNSTLTWADSGLTSLEEQIRIPLFGTSPVEMGAGERREEILAGLAQDPRYQAWFAAAFPQADAPVTWENIIVALAGFVRSLISGESAFDRFVYHQETDALSPSQLRGMELFFSERLECHHCHGDFNFTGSTTHAGSNLRVTQFHNIGLYNLDGEGAYPKQDLGLMAATGLSSDMGRFRAPTLRNVEVSGPYMHDGSIASLHDVIRFYEAGGRLIEDGPLRGDGRLSPLKSGFVTGFELTDQERDDLVNFLRSLTDPAFLRNPRFSNPHTQR